MSCLPLYYFPEYCVHEYICTGKPNEYLIVIKYSSSTTSMFNEQNDHYCVDLKKQQQLVVIYEVTPHHVKYGWTLLARNINYNTPNKCLNHTIKSLP